MDAKIQIANTTDVLEGTKVTTLAGDNLFREGVVVSDPIVGEARARCLNTTPASNEYGMSVRQVGSVDVGNFPAEYPLPTAQVTALKTPAAIDSLNAGQLFIGGAVVSVTNNTGVLQLRNPTGSGKTILLQKLFLASQSNLDVMFRKNTTVNAPTVVTPDPLNFASAVASIAEVRSGTTGSTGGTGLSPVARLLANVTTEFELPLLIPAGQSVSAQFQAGALDTVVCYATAIWMEV